jgi:hypothetical protein
MESERIAAAGSPQAAGPVRARRGEAATPYRTRVGRLGPGPPTCPPDGGAHEERLRRWKKSAFHSLFMVISLRGATVSAAPHAGEARAIRSHDNEAANQWERPLR